MEATPGIEPGYADLQSAASPLRHVAPPGRLLIAGSGRRRPDAAEGDVTQPRVESAGNYHGGVNNCNRVPATWPGHGDCRATFAMVGDGGPMRLMKVSASAVVGTCGRGRADTTRPFGPPGRDVTRF
jgi:hypothetical protein